MHALHCTAHLTPDWGRRSLVIGTLFFLSFFRPLAFLSTLVVLMLPACLHRLLLAMY